MAVEAERRLFTVDEFNHLIEAGFFGEEERIELINGELVTSGTRPRGQLSKCC